MEKNLFKYLLCVFIERAAPPPPPPEFDVSDDRPDTTKNYQHTCAWSPADT